MKPKTCPCGKKSVPAMKKLEELRKALEAATPGEWDYAIIKTDCPSRSLVTKQFGDELLRHKGGVSARAQHDVLFIALAHNMMPTLLEAVEALKAYNNASDFQFATDSALHDNARAILEKLK